MKVFLNGKATRELNLNSETTKEQIFTIPGGENTVRLEVVDSWQAAPIGIKLAVKDADGWRSECQPHRSTWLTAVGEDVKLAGPARLVRITEIKNGSVRELVRKTSPRPDERLVVEKNVPFRIEYLKFNSERRRRLAALAVPERSIAYSSKDSQGAAVYARPPEGTGQTLKAVGIFQSGSEYNNEELRERRSLSAIYRRQTPYWQFGLQPKSAATGDGTRFVNLSTEASVKPIGPYLEFSAGIQSQQIIDTEVSRTTVSLGLESRLDALNRQISAFAIFNRLQVFGSDPAYDAALSWSRDHPNFFRVGAIMEYLPTYQQSMGIMAELTTNSPGVDTNAVDSYRAAGTYKYKFTPFLAAHLALRLHEYLPDQHRSRSERQSTWLPGVTFLSSHLRSVFQGALAVEKGGKIGVQISMTTVLRGDSIAGAVPQDDYYYLMSSN